MSETRRILAGDIGGTKTLLRTVEIDGSGRRSIGAEKRFESAAYPTFDALLNAFLTSFPTPLDGACLAVAGPVINQRAEGTNLSWGLDAAALAAKFPIRRVVLINDFYAVALGVPLLAAGDLVSLNAGVRVPHAPIAILGAGTGLGEAVVIHDGASWTVVASEGGHADFAPQNDEQARLFLELHRKFGHVSWERLVSGMGLVNIHNFLTGADRAYNDRLPEEIAIAAAGGDEAARRTFAIFVDIYAAEAGNMALRSLARGGIFLAGGIAAKNLSSFTDGRFVEAFVRKGRFRDLVAGMPVDVITNDHVGLLGAAEKAVRELA